MGLPFVIIQGPTLVVDVNGNISDVVTKQGDPGGSFFGSLDGKSRLAVDSVIRGYDGFNSKPVDVETVGGKTKLLTTTSVTIEHILGFDDFADNWFALGTFADCASPILENDAIEIDIAEGACGATLQPAYNKVITVSAATAAAASPATTFAKQIESDLNADSLFTAQFKVRVVKDSDIIHIQSKLQAELGERPTPGAFAVAVNTGTFGVTLNDTVFIRRGKVTTGSRDPRDPRFVTVGISGEVQAVPGAAGDLLIASAMSELPDAGAPSKDMRVDGSVTPLSYFIRPDAEKDLFVSEIRFRGQGNGIQLTNFLSKNTALSTGVLIRIQSDNALLELPLIFDTSDFKFKFAFGSGQGFQLFDGAGTDDMLAAFTFAFTFPLRKEGTFGVGNDDFIEVVIQDDIDSGLINFEFLAFGFKREV